MYADEIVGNVNKIVRDTFCIDGAMIDGVKYIATPELICDYKTFTMNVPINGLEDAIARSVKFKIGEWDNLYDLMGYNKRKEEITVFNGDAIPINYIKLPYSKCWFEFTFNQNNVKDKTNKSSCRAALVSKNPILSIMDGLENQNAIWIILFHKNDYLQKWMIRSKYYMVDLSEYEESKNRIGEITLGLKTDYIKDRNKNFYLEDGYDLNAIEISIGLLNCNNIETIKISPQHKNKKHGVKVPQFEYHICTIKPLESKKHCDFKNGEPQYKQRLHMCRGHFKHYTKEKPLLGKHIGMYWWEPYMRGDIQKGIIKKDYQVSFN